MSNHCRLLSLPWTRPVAINTTPQHEQAASSSAGPAVFTPQSATPDNFPGMHYSRIAGSAIPAGPDNAEITAAPDPAIEISGHNIGNDAVGVGGQ